MNNKNEIKKDFLQDSMCRVCLNLSCIFFIRKAGINSIIKANLYAKIIVVFLQRAMPFTM